MRWLCRDALEAASSSTAMEAAASPGRQTCRWRTRVSGNWNIGCPSFSADSRTSASPTGQSSLLSRLWPDHTSSLWDPFHYGYCIGLLSQLPENSAVPQIFKGSLLQLWGDWTDRVHVLRQAHSRNRVYSKLNMAMIEAKCKQVESK